MRLKVQALRDYFRLICGKILPQLTPDDKLDQLIHHGKHFAWQQARKLVINMAGQPLSRQIGSVEECLLPRTFL